MLSDIDAFPNACRFCRCRSRAAWRSLADPAVQAELAGAQDALFSLTCRGLAEDMALARLMIKAMMLSPETTPATRVNAAGKILDAALRVAELVSLSSRLTALEAKVANDGQR